MMLALTCKQKSRRDNLRDTLSHFQGETRLSHCRSGPSPIRTIPSALASHQIYVVARGLGTTKRRHTADRELAFYEGLTLPRRFSIFTL